jgi:hypothetical protein
MPLLELLSVFVVPVLPDYLAELSRYLRAMSPAMASGFDSCVFVNTATASLSFG